MTKIWQIDATKTSFLEDYLDGNWQCAPAPDQAKAVILANKKIVLRKDKIVNQGYSSAVIDNGFEYVIHCPSLAREISYTTWVHAETDRSATEVGLDRINAYHAANLPQ